MPPSMGGNPSQQTARRSGTGSASGCCGPHRPRQILWDDDGAPGHGGLVNRGERARLRGWWRPFGLFADHEAGDVHQMHHRRVKVSAKLTKRSSLAALAEVHKPPTTNGSLATKATGQPSSRARPVMMEQPCVQPADLEEAALVDQRFDDGRMRYTSRRSRGTAPTSHSSRRLGSSFRPRGGSS